MNRDRLEALLSAVARGDTSVEEAVEDLRDMPFRDLGFAKLDTHRPLRTGHPEVVFGGGKEPGQIAEIVAGLAESGSPVLVTRLSDEGREHLASRFPLARFDGEAGAMALGESPHPSGCVAVLCAGTSDIPVAAEAAFTAETLGSGVVRHWDVGVAGLQRLLSVREELDGARAILPLGGRR